MVLTALISLQPKEDEIFVHQQQTRKRLKWALSKHKGPSQPWRVIIQNQVKTKWLLFKEILQNLCYELGYHYSFSQSISTKRWYLNATYQDEFIKINFIDCSPSWN